MGLMAVALYLCANWVNAVSIQSTPGYGEFPIIQLVLLWCSMPRSTWLTVLLVGPQLGHNTVASYIFAETVHQFLSAYPIITAVNYGREHSFYSQGMARLETFPSAQYMYAGALMWAIVVIVALVSLIQAARGDNESTRDTEVDAMTKRQAINNAELNIAQELMISFNKHWGRMEDALVHRWAGKTGKLEEALSTTSERHTYTVYGTLPVSGTNTQIIKKSTVRLYLIAITSLALLWIAQWLFWAGFIGISMEEYVPMCRSH